MLHFQGVPSGTVGSFQWTELTRSRRARALGLDNAPGADEQAALQSLVRQVLDPLRRRFGLRLRVGSAYRAPAVNAATPGASATSQHVEGEAADLTVDGLTAVELAQVVLEMGLPYDQLIVYAPERGGHVHISIETEGTNREERLMAPKQGGYRPWNPAIVPSPWQRIQQWATRWWSRAAPEGAKPILRTRGSWTNTTPFQARLVTPHATFGPGSVPLGEHRLQIRIDGRWEDRGTVSVQGGSHHRFQVQNHRFTWRASP